jgi:isochorismate synthase EntC
MSLAGSARPDADHTLDTDPKLRSEHALVTEAVRAALLPFCREVLVPARPGVVDLATVRHLRTRIRGVLTDPDHTGVLDLAAALHPTPAVGGAPRAAAVDWLRGTEAVDRSWYAGPVGWCCGNDGDFAVAIRCARIAGTVADLYAGNGIVAGSGPDAEVAETWWKLRVMLSALGGPEVLG